MRALSEALIETEARTPPVATTDTKVSTTPSSNRFAFTLDGICVGADPAKPKQADHWIGFWDDVEIK